MKLIKYSCNSQMSGVCSSVDCESSHIKYHGIIYTWCRSCLTSFIAICQNLYIIKQFSPQNFLTQNNQIYSDWYVTPSKFVCEGIKLDVFIKIRTSKTGLKYLRVYLSIWLSRWLLGQTFLLFMQGICFYNHLFQFVCWVTV